MDNQQYLEDEISLRDYIEVMIKRKKIILGIFFICVIAAAIFSFCMPKVYRVSMIIEPGNLGVTDGGSKLYLDSPENIKMTIEKGAFDSKIIKALDLDLKKIKLEEKINASCFKNSGIIEIYMEQKEEKIKLGLAILNQLFSEVSNNYKGIIESKKLDIEKRISIISNNIRTKSNEIKLREERIKILKKREIELSDEIKKTRSNTEKLLTKRDAWLDKRGEINDISSLLYTTTIQQNISYFNQLQDEFSNLKEKEENTRTETKNLQNEIDNLEVEIEKLNLIKDMIRNVKLVQKPEVSPYPIKPKKKLIIAMSAILGLMLGIFIAFFREFWEKSR